MKDDLLAPYVDRLGWLGSHEVEEAKLVIVDAFEKLGEGLGWRLLGEMWDWFEATYVLADIVARAAVNGRVSRWARLHFMTTDELEQFRRLPRLVTVYRGGCGPDVESGLSWSLERRVAEWFADHSTGPRRRMFGFALGSARVVAGVVPRGRLLGIKNSREELELITLPRSVRIPGPPGASIPQVTASRSARPVASSRRGTAAGGVPSAGDSKPLQ